MLTEIDLDHYLMTLTEFEARPPSGAKSLFNEDTMSYAAAEAFAHFVDGDATVEHLAAYRAWMSYCRMTHMTDEELAGARAVAADWAQKLGVE
jgi:hypothetical protein